MNWRDYKRLVYDELCQSDFRTAARITCFIMMVATAICLSFTSGRGISFVEILEISLAVIMVSYLYGSCSGTLSSFIPTTKNWQMYLATIIGNIFFAGVLWCSFFAYNWLNDKRVYVMPTNNHYYHKDRNCKFVDKETVEGEWLKDVLGSKEACHYCFSPQEREELSDVDYYWYEHYQK